MRTRVHGLSRGSLFPALLCLAFLSIPSVASAQNEYGMGDPAAYIAGSFTASFDDRDDLWAWNWGEADVEPGGSVRAGLRLGDPIAFELQGDYIRLDDWRDNNNWDITANFRIYPTLYEPLGMKGIFPDIMQPYIVAGVGVMGGSGDGGDGYQVTGAFRAGVGVDVYITTSIAISFGYEWITGTSHWSERDARNLALGLQYNF